MNARVAPRPAGERAGEAARSVGHLLASPQVGTWSLVAGVTLLVAGWSTTQPTPAMVGCFFVFFAAVRRLASRPRVSALGLTFLAAFFVFLLARPVLSWVGYPPNRIDQFAMPFNRPDVNTHIFVCLGLSLLGLHLGWWLLPYARGLGHRSTPRAYRSDSLLPSIRVVAVLMLVVCLVAQAALDVEAAIYVRDTSYFDLYTTYQTSLPAPVRVAAGATTVAFLAYLATNPRPRGVAWASGAYLGVSALSLLSGQRTTVVLSLGVVLVYLAYRSATDHSGHRWVSKRLAYGALVAVPVAFLLLGLVGRARTLPARRADGLLGPLWETLYAQSVSLEVVGYGFVYRAQVPDGHVYSLGHLLDLLLRRAPGVVGLGDGALTGQTVERAETSGLFAQLLSYRVLGGEYLKGRGLGSSYVAELWADGSYLGVFLGSVVLGLVIWFLTMGLHRSWEARLACLLLSREVVLAPRSGFSQFVVEAFTASTFVGVVLLLGGALAVRGWVQRGGRGGTDGEPEPAAGGGPGDGPPVVAA
ncbi:O-antigen polysaccharide polymerase Wzy family protein [Oryzobacter terrae]|uniref:O-antigen polysaccharide polymerase Wzy family protein n=1 Tax=Oryzobacter terrae TaxID=1620385 RepID=UPI00366AF826